MSIPKVSHTYIHTYIHSYILFWVRGCSLPRYFVLFPCIMIGISKLYLGTVEPSDALRYGRDSSRLPSHLLQFSRDKRPVVVWNVTRRCNLLCAHCYSHSDACTGNENELSHDEGTRLLDSLAEYGCPVVLFSGGEPLLRSDLVALAEYAVGRGLRAVISTNGTLITPDMAKRLKGIGLSYVGVSLDGLRDTHDRFRGVAGAYDKALAGIRVCLEEGLKVGLRVTMFKGNQHDIPGLFDLIETEGIPRICLYHLAYAGRGTELADDDLSHPETRRVLDLIIERTVDLHRRGLKKEVLTVDNHADGPYLYLRLLREDPARAARVMELLRMNGGNSTGNGIGCVSWDGAVHPDQFWRNQLLGNVRDRLFPEIWSDDSNRFLASLRNKPAHVTGRCKKCRFLSVCGGNLRVRAEAATGSMWGVDPACYLTDEEITPVDHSDFL